MQSRTSYWLLLLLASLSLVGCSSTEVEISIQATENTNDGRPFYLLVRAVDEQTYLSDIYKVVADKAFAESEDKSILEKRAIIPGQNQTITLSDIENDTKDKLLALYFLFTEPGDKWKWISEAEIPESICVQLDKNEIQSAYTGCCEQGFWRILCWLPW